MSTFSFIQDRFDGSAVKGKVREQAFHVELEEDFAEDLGAGLICDNFRDFADCGASEDTLDDEKLSQCGFMHLYFVYILKVRLLHLVYILVLYADPPIIVELALEMNMIGVFNPQIVA